MDELARDGPGCVGMASVDDMSTCCICICLVWRELGRASFNNELDDEKGPCRGQDQVFAGWAVGTRSYVNVDYDMDSAWQIPPRPV